jgi:hypothetical protein
MASFGPGKPARGWKTKRYATVTVAHTIEAAIESTMRELISMIETTLASDYFVQQIFNSVSMLGRCRVW